jgi:hypothetical protein
MIQKFFIDQERKQRKAKQERKKERTKVGVNTNEVPGKMQRVRRVGVEEGAPKFCGSVCRHFCCSSGPGARDMALLLLLLLSPACCYFCCCYRRRCRLFVFRAKTTTAAAAAAACELLRLAHHPPFATTNLTLV